MDAIARRVAKHPSTVAYWVRKYGLAAAHTERHAARGGIRLDTLAEYVGRGLSTREMAAELGCSQATIRHWLQRHGLSTAAAEMRRERAEARRLGLTVLRCERHGLTEFRHDPNGRTRCLRCRSEYVARRRSRIKRILVEEAGGGCIACGYDRFVGALSFHHLDPGQKRFGIAAGGLTRSLAASRAEASKCVLLCHNCHAEVEAGILDVGPHAEVKFPS